MKNTDQKKSKTKLVVPAIVLAITLLLAGTIGIFWWPFGIAILFLGLFIVGLGLLGNKAAEEISDAE